MTYLQTASATMSPALWSMAERVWTGAADPSSPVAVTLGAAPPGNDVVEAYAVLPHPHRARFLVPLGSRHAAAASLRKYSSLKSAAERRSRTALAAAFDSGLGQRLFRHHLVVSIDRRIPERQYGHWLILRHLGQELARKDLLAGIVIGRRIKGKVKPTLQLFTQTGDPAGYAKLGWSDATKSTVRTEAEVLASLDGRLGRLVVPSLTAAGDWKSIFYSVASPLPEGLRRWTQEPTATPEVTLEVARSLPGSCGPLSRSSYRRWLHRDLDSIDSHSPDVSRTLRDWLSRLESNPTPLEFGRWHGDWVPWNLGQSGDRLAAWDWEYSGADVPVGFDLLHWHYQQALSSGDLPRAVKAVDDATDGLASQGVARSAHRLVASLYLLEIFVRAAKNSVGRGWNPRVYPALLAVAGARDRGPISSA